MVEVAADDSKRRDKLLVLLCGDSKSSKTKKEIKSRSRPPDPIRVTSRDVTRKPEQVQTLVETTNDSFIV